MHDEWTLIQNYNSEVEARVVESFLKAHGFEVQLLDTHAPIHRLVPTSKVGGLRLLVRTSQAQAVQDLLAESQKPNHLTIVGDPHPVTKSKTERWIIALILILAILVYTLIKRA